MTAEPRPGSGTPDADDGHTINVGPVTVADPGSGTPADEQLRAAHDCNWPDDECRCGSDHPKTHPEAGCADVGCTKPHADPPDGPTVGTPADERCQWVGSVCVAPGHSHGFQNPPGTIRRCPLPEGHDAPAAPSPAPLDVRLYGTPDDERLDCDPDEAVQSYLDGFCGEFPVTITLEEHDTYPPRVHFPSGDYAAEWCAEWSADNDTDEGFGDQAMDAAKDPAVVAAFDAAIDLLASKITYRMADKVTASYEVTITDESTWTYDPEFVSPLAAADREEPT